MAASKGVLNLKVLLVDQGKTSIMRFMGFMSVAEVCKEIRDKTGFGGDDHGVFVPGQEAGANTAGRWLRADRTLNFYDFITGDTIHYKKKHRPFKVKLLDESVKTILIDESLSVNELTDVIGERINLTNPEEFSLKVEGHKTWLNPTQTVHENQVPDDALLVLGRKFWFSDANVTLESPMELHLLYTQAARMVLEGSLPTTRGEAIELAALRCQVTFKGFDPEKHTKKGWLDATEFLPPQFHKRKVVLEMEKEVRKSFMKLHNMNDLNAKYRYVQLARSLPTWGITHYLVEEKVVVSKRSNKVKWRPIRLGVTRKSIMLLDAASYEVIKEWPLTHLKRWAGSKASFTLDFGDFEEEYYIVKTLEGEAISQQISGYIDIILKQRRDAPKLRMDDNSHRPNIKRLAPVHGMATAGTTMSLGHGNHGANSAGASINDPNGQVMGRGGANGQGFGAGGGGLAGVDGFGAGGVASITDLNSAIAGVDAFMNQLNMPGGVNPLPDMSAEGIAKSFEENFVGAKHGALLLANAAVAGQGLDAMAAQVAQNLAAMINAAKQSAAEGDQNVSLLPGAYALSEAVARTLQCARDLQMHPNDSSKRLAMWSAQEALKSAEMYMSAAKQGILSDGVTKDLMLASALALANATGQLKAKAHEIANGDPNGMAYGDHVGILGEHVAFTAKTLAPSILHPQCQEAVYSAGGELKKACGNLLMAFKQTGLPHSVLMSVGAATKDVNDLLTQLMDISKLSGAEDATGLTFDGHAAAIRQAVPTLSHSQATVDHIVAAYRNVVPSTQALIQNGTLLAQRSPEILASALANTVRTMHGTTSEMYETVRAISADPSNPALRTKIGAQGDTLLANANRLASDGERRTAVLRLRGSAKQAAVQTLTLGNHSRALPLADQALATSLGSALLAAQAAIGKLVRSLRENTDNPTDPAVEKELLIQAKATALPASTLVATVKRCLPRIQDAATKDRMKQMAQKLTGAIGELMNACSALEDLGGGKQVREAMEGLEAMLADLESSEIAAASGMLNPLPGQTKESTVQLLTFTAKKSGHTVTELQRLAIDKPEQIGGIAQVTGEDISQVIEAAKSVAAAFNTNKKTQRAILLNGKTLAQVGMLALGASLAASQSPEDDRVLDKLSGACGEVQAALAGLLNSAKGLDLEELNKILAALQQRADDVRVLDKASNSFDDAAQALRESSDAVKGALANLVAVAGPNPKALGGAARMLSSAVDGFVDNINEAATSCPDGGSRGQMILYGKTVAKETARTVAASRVAASNGDSVHQPLLDAHSNVALALGNLMGVLRPGQAALDEAMARVQAALAALRGGSQAAGGGETKNPLPALQAGARRLGDATRDVVEPGITPGELGQRSRAVATTVEEIIRATQAALANAPAESSSNAASSSAASSSAAPSASTLALTKTLQDINRSLDVVLRKPVTLSAVVPAGRGITAKVREALGLDLTAEQKQKVGAIGGGAGNLLRNVRAVAGNQAGAEAQLHSGAEALRQLVAELLAELQQAGPPTPMAGGPSGSLQHATAAAATSACQLLTAAGAALGRAKNRGGLSQAARAVSEAIATLADSADLMAPGAVAVRNAQESIQAAIGKLDALRFAEKRQASKSMQVCHQEINTVCQHLNALLQQLVAATIALKGDDIGKSATETSEAISLLVKVTDEWVQAANDDRQRNNHIDMSKSIADAVSESMQAAAGAARNPTAEIQRELQASAHTVHSALSAIITKMQGGVVGLRECDSAVQAVNAAYTQLQEPLTAVPPESFRNYRQKAEEQSATLSQAVGRLSQAAKMNVDKVGIAAQNIANIVPLLFYTLKNAANSSSETGAKDKLFKAANAVASALLAALGGARAIAAEGHSNNAALQAKLSTSVNGMTQATIGFREALKDADGEQRIVDAALTEFARILTDIEGVSLITASGGAVELPKGASGTLADAHGLLLREAKHVTSSATQFARAAKVEPSAIPRWATKLSADMDQLVGACKRVAAASGEQFSQQALFHSAKSVNVATQQLVLFGKDGDDDGDNTLADPGLLLADSIEKLVDTSNSACAHVLVSCRGLQDARRRALQALRQLLDAGWKGSAGAHPRDIQAASRALAKQTGTIASSLNSSDTLVESTQAASVALQDIMASAKNCATQLAPSPEVKEEVLRSAGHVGRATYGLLTAAKQNQGSQDLAAQKRVADAAEAVSDSLVDLLGNVRQLPGGEAVELEKDDLADAAQRELNAAAQKIEAATKRLLAIKPPPPTPGSSLNEAEINAAILEAVKAVMNATQQLIIASTAVQKELVAAGKTNKAMSPYRRDPAWARGLISAAYAVADTTDQLVEATNSTVCGSSGIEGIVASVRIVGGATARLVTASRVKADPNSPSQQKLETASRRVTKATRMLAEAAKNIAKQSAEAEAAAEAAGPRRVGKASAIAEEFRKQQEIAELELRLERARGRLGKSRRDKYKN